MAEGPSEGEQSKEDQGPTTTAEKLQEVLRLIKEDKEAEALQLLRSDKELLHEACESGSVEAVNLLLDRGVTVSEWNKAHLLPLHLAAKNNHIGVVEALLKREPEVIDRPSKYGETPLHFACLHGHLSMVKLLIDCKADVRIDDRCGNTALHYAVSSNNPELVEFLLRDKDLVQLINKRNQFHHSPLHRAAILQCVEVIGVLSAYKAKLTIRDKNGLTPFDIASLLYDNKRVTHSEDGTEKTDPIMPLSSGRMSQHLSPASTMSDYHSRSSSFSHYRPSVGSINGSTTSLPVAAGIQKKRASATSSKRPVNLSFSQSYSRQVSGASSQGSRNSEIYLKDKEQAEKLSEALEKQSSIDGLEKIVLDQTSYEPPFDMFFVPPVESFSLSHDQTRYHSKDHDIILKVDESYWVIDSNETIDCKMAATLQWGKAFPSGYVFVSPVVFLSCRAKRSCEVKITLPHALHFPSEKHHKRIIVFSTTTVNIEAIISSPSHREFRRLATSDLVVEMHNVSFTTSIRYPSLFVVGMALSPSNPPHPLLPMRCCLYVACPSDKEQYLTNVDILVFVAMNLKTVEMAMKSYVIPHEYTLEEKGFVLSGAVLKINSKSENNQWQVTRRGSGHLKYNQVALSPETEFETSVSHKQSYPLREALFVECNDVNKTLKCRISVESDGKELVNMLITPYVPIRQAPTLDPFNLRESITSPNELSSSSESIPLRTSSV